MALKTRKQKTEILKNALLGVNNEPEFTPLNSTKVNLIKGLNFYSLRDFQPKDSKQFALDWAKDACPDLLRGLKSVAEDRFENRGYVCRMISRGFVLDTDEEIRHFNFFKDLCSPSADTQKEEKIVLSTKKPVAISPENAVIESIEYEIDNVLRGLPTTKTNNFDGSSKNTLKGAAEHFQRLLTELVEDAQSAEPQYRAKTRESLTKYLSSVIGEIEQKSVSAPVAKREAKPLSEPVAKAKARELDKKLVGRLIVGGKTIKGISVSAVIGKSSAIVYNIRARTLCIFNAKNESGLSVKGVSVLNADGAKVKKISKVGDFFSNTKSTFTDLTKAFLTLPSETAVRNVRLGEDCIVLAVSR